MINTYTAYSPTATPYMKGKLTKCESEFECNFPYFDKNMSKHRYAKENGPVDGIKLYIPFM